MEYRKSLVPKLCPFNLPECELVEKHGTENFKRNRMCNLYDDKTGCSPIETHMKDHKGFMWYVDTTKRGVLSSSWIMRQGDRRL